jgi:hypothetical protein
MVFESCDSWLRKRHQSDVIDIPQKAYRDLKALVLIMNKICFDLEGNQNASIAEMETNKKWVDAYLLVSNITVLQAGCGDFLVQLFKIQQ